MKIFRAEKAQCGKSVSPERNGAKGAFLPGGERISGSDAGSGAEHGELKRSELKYGERNVLGWIGGQGILLFRQTHGNVLRTALS